MPAAPHVVLAIVTAVAAGAQPRSGGRPGEAKPLSTVVPFPHPLITEVLFAVPDGAAGDANRDGVRSATGDEFIELVNPHKRPINLEGYTVTDTPRAQGQNGPAKGGGGGGSITYVFGAVTLAPGQVVVVFNGYRGEGDEPVGAPPPLRSQPSGREDTRRVSKRPPLVVLSIKPRSRYAALGNEGDCVVLIDPRGRAVHAIAWGDHDERSAGEVERSAPLRERAEGPVRGSIARRGLTRGMGPHAEIPAFEGAPFSPGVFEPDPEATATREVRPAQPEEVDPADPSPEEPDELEEAPPTRPSGPEPAGPPPREKRARAVEQSGGLGALTWP